MGKIKFAFNAKIIFIIGTILLIIFLVLLVPMDFFTHGFYCNSVNYEDISEEDKIGSINLADGSYSIKFSPQKKHFAGFEFIFTSIQENASGNINVQVSNRTGAVIETVRLKLSDIENSVWYIVKTTGNYEKGGIYTLEIASENCNIDPCMQLCGNRYLSPEILEDHLLIAFGYSEPVFQSVEKVLIFLGALSIWGFFFSEIILSETKLKYGRQGALFIALTVVLCWNYMYNSFDEENKGLFAGFQADSETLVSGMIRADSQHLETDSYGLGRYYGILVYDSYTGSFLNNENWENGYHREKPMVCISDNIYTQETAVIGNQIQFSSGDIFKIIGTGLLEDEEGWRYLVLDSQDVLDPAQFGSLEAVKFINDAGQELPQGKASAYLSQYGLQGKIFRYLAGIIGENLTFYHFLCSFAAANIFSMIILLLWRKYNGLMAACYGVTFLLSPWIVNFARNLYWVEFTWFLPMLTGLICSIWIKKKWIRIACYVGAFFTVAIKCLCGYEYLTAIMLGMISFLLIDWVLVLIDKNKEEKQLLFKTIFFMGISALLGFAAAICIHARLRGNGNIAEGIQSIIETDVLRRTGAGNLNDFDPVFWPSLNASIWDACKKYFHFYTDIIAGIDNNMFPLLCGIPFVIFFSDYYRKKLQIDQLVMYIVFFLVSVSWFILGKSHSYIHTHMNYVLWYFGYIQICFYIIIRKILNVLKKGKV